eukprot:SAG31_NODE_1095_length_9928_cov_5.441042_1_plen_117_part_10
MVHEDQYGYCTVIPHQREDIFRALVKWLHEDDHSRPDQLFQSIRRRFFWHSPEKMMKVVKDVYENCATCATRKRATSSLGHVPSPITIGNRPFEVISIALKPMPTTDEDTGCDAFLA